MKKIIGRNKLTVNTILDIVYNKNDIIVIDKPFGNF